MKIKSLPIVLIGLIFMSFSLSKGVDKKVSKNIMETFDVEKFTKQQVLIDPEINENLPSEFGKDNLFKIVSSDKKLGYAYIADAPSKTDEFTYLVILDKDLIVRKSKVLVYREDYGGEIGSKRWLKQFIGKTTDDSLKYGDNVVAISGATISVKSMTKAMNDLLKSLKILEAKDVL